MAIANDYQSDVLRDQITSIKSDRDRKQTRADTLLERIDAVELRFDAQIATANSLISDLDDDIADLEDDLSVVKTAANDDQDAVLDDKLIELNASKTVQEDKVVSLTAQKASTILGLNTSRNTLLNEIAAHDVELNSLIFDWEDIFGLPIPDIE